MGEQNFPPDSTEKLCLFLWHSALVPKADSTQLTSINQLIRVVILLFTFQQQKLQAQY